MPGPDERYRNYLGARDSGPEAVAPLPPPADIDPRVLICQNRVDGTWSALFERGVGLVADADGMTREDAITWARRRCDNVWIFTPGSGDFQRLEPSG